MSEQYHGTEKMTNPLFQSLLLLIGRDNPHAAVLVIGKKPADDRLALPAK
jgi:hypothetical protein